MNGHWLTSISCLTCIKIVVILVFGGLYDMEYAIFDYNENVVPLKLFLGFNKIGNLSKEYPFGVTSN